MMMMMTIHSAVVYLQHYQSFGSVAIMRRLSLADKWHYNYRYCSTRIRIVHSICHPLKKQQQQSFLGSMSLRPQSVEKVDLFGEQVVLSLLCHGGCLELSFVAVVHHYPNWPLSHCG